MSQTAQDAEVFIETTRVFQLQQDFKTQFFTILNLMRVHIENSRSTVRLLKSNVRLSSKCVEKTRTILKGCYSVYFTSCDIVRATHLFLVNTSELYAILSSRFGIGGD